MYVCKYIQYLCHLVQKDNVQGMLEEFGGFQRRCNMYPTGV